VLRERWSSPPALPRACCTACSLSACVAPSASLRVQGLCCLIGETSDAGLDIVCVVEGFATGASVHEATGHTVAVAFHAGIRAKRGRARMEEDGRRRVAAINPALLDSRE